MKRHLILPRPEEGRVRHPRRRTKKSTVKRYSIIATAGQDDIISRLPVRPVARENAAKNAMDEMVAPLESIKVTKRDFLQFLQRSTTDKAQRRARIIFKGYAKKVVDISIQSLSTNIMKNLDI
jgi:hypothetical protein